MTKKSNRGGLRNPPGGRPAKSKTRKMMTFRIPLELVNKLTQEENATKLIVDLLTVYYHKKDQNEPLSTT